jgi:hypothetical protein
LVTELLEALDLPPKTSVFPHSKLNKALQIVPRFSSLLEDLTSFAIPPDYSNPEKCRLIDEKYRQLIQFRSHNLKKKVTELVKEDLGILFGNLAFFVSDGDYNYSDHEPADLSKPPRLAGTLDKHQATIPRIFNLLRRSNFGILQSMWTECEDYLGEYVLEIHHSINKTKDRDPARTQPGFNALIPGLLKLLDQTIILLKVSKVFSHKIGSTRLFTFSEDMSSADLERFGDVPEKFSFHILSLMTYLTTVAEFQEKPPGWDLKQEGDLIRQDVNFSLEFIRSHMIPSDPAQSVDDVMDALFGTFKQEFFPTLDRTVAGITQFQADD